MPRRFAATGASRGRRVVATTEVAPRATDGALDLSNVERVGRVARGDRRFVFLANGEDVLVAFARIRVPVDLDADEGEGWSRRRLKRRRDVLAALGAFRPKPVDKDRYGNVFTWRGRAPRGTVYVRYRPEDDVMDLLFVSARPG